MPLLMWRANTLTNKDRQGVMAELLSMSRAWPRYRTTESTFQIRAYAIADEQGQTRIWWVNQPGQTGEGNPRDGERLIAHMTVESGWTSHGLWTRELWIAGAKLYVDFIDEELARDHDTIRAWVQDWRQQISFFRNRPVRVDPGDVLRDGRRSTEDQAVIYQARVHEVDWNNTIESLLALLASVATLYSLATIREWLSGWIGLLRWRRRRTERRKRRGLCVACGYNLNDLDDAICPECGTVNPLKAPPPPAPSPSAAPDSPPIPR